MTIIDEPGIEYELRDQILHRIDQHERAHTRNHQTAVGPSEIGHPCDRRLAYRALNIEAANDEGGARWYPIIGTAVHAWLADAFGGHEGAVAEQRVHINHWLSGTGDLWLPDHGGIVLDWKIVGNAALKKYKEDGPGEQYRRQGHLYGVGWLRQGKPVAHVAIAFLPRANRLNQAYIWTEPMNVILAAETVTRYDTIAEIAITAGPAVLPLIPTADASCEWCPFYMPAVTDTTLACPGHAVSHLPRTAQAAAVPAEPGPTQEGPNP